LGKIRFNFPQTFPQTFSDFIFQQTFFRQHLFESWFFVSYI